MPVNKENMEKWINALETYQGKQARYQLVDSDGSMCAMGIGIHTWNPQALRTTSNSDQLESVRAGFYGWLGVPNWSYTNIDLPLKVRREDPMVTSVTQANDFAEEDTWTIAQRLRETYLKEES